MSWQFDVFSKLTAAPNAPTTTRARYAAQDSPNGQIRVIGNGFTYDATTGLLNGGNITSF